MATHLDHHIDYQRDDPHKQASLARRYGWSILLYASFAALAILLLLAMR